MTDKNHMQNRSAYGGFTIIELSIVIIIFGMMVIAVMTAYSLYTKQQATQETNDRMMAIEVALTEYQSLFGGYPCPANPALAPGDPQYGRDQRPPAPGGEPDMTLACVNVGATVAGVDADRNGAGDTVYIGAVPIATLLDPDRDPQTDDGVLDLLEDVDLGDNFAIDGWGRKIKYAVTGSQTLAPLYNNLLGAIEVRDENGLSVLNTEDLDGDGVLDPGENRNNNTEDVNGNGVLDAGEDVNANGIIDPLMDPGIYAHFILLSHGENGRGARMRNGNVVDPCPVGVGLPAAVAPEVANPVNEVENCNDLNGIFLSGLRTERDHSYNDDRILYFVNQDSDLWQILSDTQIHNTNGSNVGIGTNSPDTTLDVNGDIQINNVRAIEYCDVNDNNCMGPEVIGGNDPNMQCPPGEVVESIEQNRVNCTDAFNINAPAGTQCPPGQYLQGISNITGIICCDPGAGGC
ncbi:MAG: hypothetical protein IT558_00830 [Alphaproteobacteria bacterium]|nr:hypothetical protein [Alphaproteobacteria bacterium]